MRRIEDVAAIRFAQQIGTLGTARSTATNSRSIPMANWSAPARSISFDKLRTIGSSAASAHPEPVEGASERFPGGLRQAQGAKAGNAIDQMELSRLKKQWHKEWAKTAERDRAIKANEQSREREDALLDRLATMHRRWYLQLGPKSRAAFRAFRELEASEPDETDDWRMAEIDAEDARIALAEAKSKWDAEDAREALTQAEAHQAAHKADMAAAEAEYAEWFSDERRAKVWWAIDVVFGAVSKPGGDAGEKKI